MIPERTLWKYWQCNSNFLYLFQDSRQRGPGKWQFNQEGLMKKALTLSLILVLCSFTLALEKEEPGTASNVIKIGTAAPADTPVKEIEVNAKKYEYTPALIEVPVN